MAILVPFPVTWPVLAVAIGAAGATYSASGTVLNEATANYKARLEGKAAELMMNCQYTCDTLAQA